MRIYDTAQRSFADQLSSRLLDLEPKLRTRVQQIERDAARRHRDRVELTTAEARTILRALLPACMALGRKRRGTLRLQAALAGFTIALTATTEPRSEDHAINAALVLLQELQDWITELRWHQATRRAHTAWQRPAGPPAITAILRQSTAAKPERKPNRRAIAKHVAGAGTQSTLLLPIAGDAERNAAAANPTGVPTKRQAA